MLIKLLILLLNFCEQGLMSALIHNGFREYDARWLYPDERY